jgi:hypothetical protein
VISKSLSLTERVAAMKIKHLTIILLSLLISQPAHLLMAQTNHLEKKISINFNQVKLKNALPKIGEAGGFQFSYNSEIIPGDSLVNIHAKDQPVKTILKNLVGPDIRFKVIGNHVILLSDVPLKSEKSIDHNQEYTITGYIYDAQTGEIISSASIYEVDGMFVSATDAKGFYSITVPGDQDSQVLSYSKIGYADTLIIVKPKVQPSLNISLIPKARILTENQLSGLPVSKINDRTLVKALVPARSLTATENIPAFEQRFGQLSLVPFVGSNRFVSGLITNRVSLNILAGYSGGVNGVELGGFLNVVSNDMYGVQLSGFGNIVGKKSQGVQLSGFFNVDAGSFNGLQATGFSNIVTDTIRGVQLAGFSNVLHGPMYGTQVSGFSNFTSQNVDGIQASGFANIALKEVKVAQVGGFGNYAKSVGGLQAAGFLNIATGISKGTQVAGFANYATEVQGLQLSVFNFADTVSTGVPIGLLSFVAKGYHSIEVSANDLLPLNISLKTGIRRFYNILTAGIQKEFLSVGYGLGTQVRVAKRMTVSIDLTGNYLASNRRFVNSKGALVRLSPTLDFELGKYFKFVIGPTLNGFAGLDHADAGTADFPFLFSLPVKNLMIVSTPVSIRIGAMAGFRF